jgi:hypothetical protein
MSWNGSAPVKRIHAIDTYLAIRIARARGRAAGQRGNGHPESNAANREMHDVGVGIVCRNICKMRSRAWSSFSFTLAGQKSIPESWLFFSTRGKQDTGTPIGVYATDPHKGSVSPAASIRRGRDDLDDGSAPLQAGKLSKVQTLGEASLSTL